MVLPVALLRMVVNVPTTYTRLPMYSRSKISPVVMRGKLVRTVSETSTVCPGPAIGVTEVTCRVVWAVAAPSDAVSVTVRVPAVA